MTSGSKPKVYPSGMVEKVRQLYDAGHTQSEIAKSLSTTQKVIWNLMRRHNIKARVAFKRNQTGKRNSSWKGKEAGYQAKHLRVSVARGKPIKCEECNTTDKSKSYDWACVNGDYDDILGFVRMCRSCHWKHDKKHKNLGKYAEKKEVQYA